MFSFNNISMDSFNNSCSLKDLSQYQVDISPKDHRGIIASYLMPQMKAKTLTLELDAEISSAVTSLFAIKANKEVKECLNYFRHLLSKRPYCSFGFHIISLFENRVIVAQLLLSASKTSEAYIEKINKSSSDSVKQIRETFEILESTAQNLSETMKEFFKNATAHYLLYIFSSKAPQASSKREQARIEE